MLKGSDAATWGCLGTGMIVLGAFSIYIFELVGGTDYEVEYMSAASAVSSAAILILLVLQSRGKVGMPRLNPVIAAAALAVVLYGHGTGLPSASSPQAAQPSRERARTRVSVRTL